MQSGTGPYQSPEQARGIDDELHDNIEVLLGLWQHPYVEKSHLTGNRVFLKELEHTMQVRTNICLGSILMVVLLAPQIPGVRDLQLIGTYVVLFIVGLALQYGLCKFHKNKIAGKKSDLATVKDTLLKCLTRQNKGIAGSTIPSNLDKSYSRWLNCALLSPFGYRFVWWWTLIIGIVGVQINCIENGRVPYGSVKFNQGFMSAIATAVFAYIATNVIHELVLVRDRYRDTGEKVDGLNRALNHSEKAIETVMNGLESANETIESCEAILHFGLQKDQWNSYYEDEDKKTPRLKSQKTILLQNASLQASNFISQVKSANNPEASICVAGTLNAYLRDENALLNGQKKHLVTTYAGLGSISKSIVQAIYPKFKGDKQEVTFYGIILLSPEEFITKAIDIKNFRGNAHQESEAERNEWLMFLQNNYLAARNHIKQNRIFSSLAAESDVGVRNPRLYKHLFNLELGDIVKCCVLKTFGTRCAGLFLLFIIPASEARFWGNRLSRFEA